MGLLIAAVRTAWPLRPSAAYGGVAVAVVAAVLIAVPGILLLLAKSFAARKRALLWVFVTYSYLSALVPIVDWTRFGTAGFSLALAWVSGYLYYVTAKEIEWTREQSEPSSPP